MKYCLLYILEWGLEMIRPKFRLSFLAFNRCIFGIFLNHFLNILKQGESHILWFDNGFSRIPLEDGLRDFVCILKFRCTFTFRFHPNNYNKINVKI